MEQSSTSTTEVHQSVNTGAELSFNSVELNETINQNTENIAQQSYENYSSTSATGYDIEGSSFGVADAAANIGGEYYSSSSATDVFGSSNLTAGSNAFAQQEYSDVSVSGAATGFDSTGFNSTGFDSTGFDSTGFDSTGFEQQSFSSSSATTTATTYATDANGLFQDSNPQVISRPALGGVQTQTQRVTVRFLQPPPLPPPGPLIIKEVRPPQPPPPPPLYIRQKPPPPPVQPPIVIREAPPKLPPVVGTQVITKMLPAIPVPPRSVIIERLPPLPPKPRDVIVERWLPYPAQQKRRVIIQRAPPPVQQAPRNIIIYYEAPQAKVVRRFENLGIQMANPADYAARYGNQLQDAQTLLAQARQAGVVEDISVPVGSGIASNFQSSNFDSSQFSGIDTGATNFDSFTSSTDGYNFSTAGNTEFSSFSEGVTNDGSLYNASSDATGYGQGITSSFGDFGDFGGAAGYTEGATASSFDHFGGADSSSAYQSYSSEQTYTQSN